MDKQLNELTKRIRDVIVSLTSRSVYKKNEITFGFCRLLGFQLMPFLENIYEQKLSLVDSADAEQYPKLRVILSRAINWELIKQQYHQMIPFSWVPALLVSHHPPVSSYQWV